MTRNKRQASEVVRPSANESIRPRHPESSGSSLLARLRSGVRSFKGAIAAIAGVGAVLGGLAGYWNAYRTSSDIIQPLPVSTVGKGDAGPLSLVVLPFKNHTGDPNQAYVADGITAAVTADVARIRNAFVVSTTTAFAYKDKPSTAQQIGKELGVRFALTGGVQRSKDTLLVTAELADTINGAQLWAETFHGDQSDLLTLQESVRTRIAESIGQETLKAAASTSQARSSNPRVVDLTLRARAIRLTKSPSAQSFREAIALYRQAVRLDPNDLEASIGLATTLVLNAHLGLAADAAEKDSQLHESEELVLKVRPRAQDDSNVYVVLGIIASYRGDFEGARRADETALALEPKSPRLLANLADDYLDAGQPDRAIPFLEQAIRLNPRSPHWTLLANLGRAHLMAGHESAAIDWSLRARDAAPQLPSSSVYLAAAYARLGKVDQARAAAMEALRVSPSLKALEFEPPRPGYPTAYREYWESKLLPALRLAGLPS